MFYVTVAAKFSTHAKIKYTELKLMDLLSLGLMCVKKIHHFLSGIKNMRTKENWFLFFYLTVYVRTHLFARYYYYRGLFLCHPATACASGSSITCAQLLCTF